MNTQQKYRHLDAIDAVIEKSWAVGGATPTKRYEIVVPDQDTSPIQKILFSPALWKIADEIIVNAVDHVVRCRSMKDGVTEIRISFDETTGVFNVYNNGPGIEIEIHEEYSKLCGTPTWIPTMLFGVFNQGSNHHSDPSTIIGGVNGLGGKATNCFSASFLVQTADEQTRQTFSQLWKNHMRETELPTITPWPKTKNAVSPFTRIEFLPDYSLFKDGEGNLPDRATISMLMRSRAVFTACYAGYASKGKCKVRYNQNHIPVNNLKKLVEVFFPQEVSLHATLTPSEIHDHQKYPWELSVVIRPTVSEFSACTIVNGIVVRSGTHISFIRGLIVAGVRGWYTEHHKNLKISGLPGKIESNVFIMMNTQIPAPQWDGQRKENMSAPRKFKGYSLPAVFISRLSELLKPFILDKVSNYKPPKPKHNYEKYLPAKFAGTSRRHECSLIIVEGDSVKNHILGPVAKYLGRDCYGIIDTRGVPMNSRKHATREIINDVGIVCPDAKFEKNEFMVAIYSILGLNYNYTYDPANPAVANKELQQLNYGHLVACVDQDHDGKGNILALIAGYIEQFWPHLFARGFVQWFQTPIIRIYPRSSNSSLTVKEFYSTTEYDIWSNNTPPKTVKLYEHPRYYKGVGSHSDREIDHIFKNFTKRLITFHSDWRTAERFNVYLGVDPNDRKVELAIPYEGLTRDETLSMDTKKLLSASRYLETDVKLYQLDNLDRKLPNVADGLNQIGRKILDGLLAYYRAYGAKHEKVSTLAGFIGARTAYQHGETSMFDAIRGKGFIGCGGRQLPIIEVYSNFGSRMNGGADAASPRYISCSLNYRLVHVLYPDIDYADLPIAFDEGVRIEPVYFAPILPMVVLESVKIPTHGWKNETWARCVHHVIDIVKYLILEGGDAPMPIPQICTYSGAPYAWTGTFRYIGGRQYSVGRYELDTAKMTITVLELPLRKWSTKYHTKLMRDADPEIVLSPERIENYSDKQTPKIVIKLAPGALNVLASRYSEISSGDALHEGILAHFKLQSPITHSLNFVSPYRDSVLSYTEYSEPIREWFRLRKKHYGMRVDRQKICLGLEILRLEQIIRFVEFSATSPLAGKRKAVMETVLKENGFARLCSSHLDNPREIPTARLTSMIVDSPTSSYDYLLNMGDNKKSMEALDGYLDKLNRFEARLREVVVEKFPGASQWLTELKEISGIIRSGSSCGWEAPGAEKFKFE
jgi:DNA topoisomerase-2